MEGKEHKKMLSCMIKNKLSNNYLFWAVQTSNYSLYEFLNIGPGPVYKLPTLVGYNGHDPSRHRNPAFSMQARTGIKTYIIGPGPHYNIRNLTKSGSDNPPAYTIRGKEILKCKHKISFFQIKVKKNIIN